MKKIIKLIIIICLIICLMPIFINFYVIIKTKDNIYSSIEEKYDIGLILGCSVKKNNEPSKMLRDRLNKGIELYENEIIAKILISGDHRDGYSEIDVMYDYLINGGILKDDILIDKEGYSTSDSIRNYAKNYHDKSVIIITQKYHLYRALYILDKLDLDGVGVYAKLINYDGQFLREIREILARNKDFFLTLN